MKVLLLRTWLTNIGNAFIENGATVCIRRAFRDAQVIETSGFPNHVAYYQSLGIKNQLLGVLRGVESKAHLNPPSQYMTINIADFINDIDVAIIAGCILDISLIKYLPTLKKIREREIPLVFLGAGGSDYTNVTQKYVKEIIRKLKPEALLTRDPIAFKTYADHFDFAYNGIDCGFFINDWYFPPKTKKTFIMATFDSIEEPKLKPNYTIVRAFHEPFYYAHVNNLPLNFTVELTRKIFRLKMNKASNSKIFISDNVKDYLFLYANAKETHSDRVHACVASLSYGNKARFYSHKHAHARATLFDKVLEKDITREIVSLPKEKIEQEKHKNVRALKEALEKLL